MPFDTFDPPVRQSPGTKVAPEVKKLAATFGDGYTQESPDGLNNVRMVANLTWSALLPAQAEEIFNFFVAHKGTIPFYYALTDDVLRQWKCEQFDKTKDTPNQVTATFKESFVFDDT